MGTPTKFKRLLHRLYSTTGPVDRFSLGDRKGSEAPELSSHPEPSFTSNARENAKLLEQLFHYPKNKGFTSSTLALPNKSGQWGAAYLLYVKGLVDQNFLNARVVEPLQKIALDWDRDRTRAVQTSVLKTTSSLPSQTLQQVQEMMLRGHAALFLPHSPVCLLVDVASVMGRKIGEPKTEIVIRGSHEGFVENHDLNIGLIQKEMLNQNLIVENIMNSGTVQARLSMLYLDNLANPKLVEEVRRRLSLIQVTSLLTSGSVVQQIEDAPYSLMPTLAVTERPDRSCAMILDGHVIVLVDHSPFAILCPTTFWTMFHTSEEYNLRMYYGNFIRLIRLLSCFFALYAPGIYIALTNFQPEMIPTDLMLAIAGSRETLPFPTFLEILIMEFAFELIREAGLRLPSVIGSTIGIVGALILGQAAVQANIISPILVILVSITGLGSFAIPNQDLSFAIRIFRFVFLALGGTLGFLGISVGTVFMLAHIVSLQSFGVPFMAPRFPHMKSNRDFIFRGQNWLQKVYGQHTRPQQEERFHNEEGRQWDHPKEE
ncbi:spore germination protein [Tumebacillus sp. ITR2]|uniref:Spore germination protein n=1 Tax=Tumebacillus amylolyticus TaxID=2801339 RepID=A0ABS1JFI6_9BACL|nr:spore germination protein [Tumebacillus amylolyticus]MBL0389024.1 spore germination protein [Tumebacillus amylolyticus]